MADTPQYYLGKVKIPYNRYKRIDISIRDRELLYTIGLFWFISPEDYEKHQSLNFLKIINQLRLWLGKEFKTDPYPIGLALHCLPTGLGVSSIPLPDLSRLGDKEVFHVPIPRYEEGGYHVKLCIILKQKTGFIYSTLPDCCLFSSENIMIDDHPIKRVKHAFIFDTHHDWKKHEDNGYSQLHNICLDTVKFMNLSSERIDCITNIYTHKLLGYISSYPSSTIVPLFV